MLVNLVHDNKSKLFGSLTFEEKVVFLAIAVPAKTETSHADAFSSNSRAKTIQSSLCKYEKMY